MLCLGIDTSNYATSLAVYNSHAKEVVCALKRMLPVPKGSTGLRQSDAVFHHTLALPALFEEMAAAAPLGEVAVVGVSARPRDVEGSYMPCFLAGISAAAAFAAAQGLPVQETTHQQGHLAAALFGTGNAALAGRDILFFHVSGGTTELLLCRGYQVLARVGGSLDLFAGQAVDRIGVQMGFGFPAGEKVSALAEECGEDFRPKTSVKGSGCHLSGLQNQCEKMLADRRPQAETARYCLQFIAQSLLEVAENARRAHGPLPIVYGGGVMCSSVIRAFLTQRQQDVWFVPPQFSADNAAGVAIIAAQQGEGA